MEGVPISLIFICVVVVSPIAEELLFRKVLLERLLPYGEFSAIGISSVLFGLYHFNFEQLFYTALLGVVCVNIVMKTGKVRYAIYEHMLFNLFGGIISGFIPNNFYINLIIKTIFFIGAIIICIFWGKELFILETNPKTRSKKLDMKSEVRCGGFILFILFFLVNAIGTLIEI